MWKTQQTFNETPDGLRTVFTTALEFEIGSLFVTQGALFVSNYLTQNHTTIEFDTPPIPENGELLWAGMTYIGDSGFPTQFPAVTGLVGIVPATEIITILRYSPDLFEPIVTFVNWEDFCNFIEGLLLENELTLQRYLRPTDFWTRIIASPPAESDRLLFFTARQALIMLFHRVTRERYDLSMTKAMPLSSESIRFEGVGTVEYGYRDPGADYRDIFKLPVETLLDRMFCQFLTVKQQDLLHSPFSELLPKS